MNIQPTIGQILSVATITSLAGGLGTLIEGIKRSGKVVETYYQVVLKYH